METGVFSIILALMTMLMIASLAAILRKKIPLPYSIILLLLGAGIALVADYFPAFQYIADFHLSPELIFYVFLPTLIFESAFHMNLLHFRRSFKTITFLSTITFAISMVIIAYGAYYYFDIPILVSLLFGSIVSATDPIATLALFKEIGAPPRLTTIIEGESLLNDGMALVMFGILIELIRKSSGFEGLSTILSFSGKFTYVVAGGIIVGGLLGYLFSILIAQIKNNRDIEITLTIILAHTTFLFAESFIGVSGIIATMIAGMVIGNFGRHKISPSVEEFMSHFWDFAAFISNSIIFLLVGKELVTRFANLNYLSLRTIIIAVLIGLIARIISVYVSMPFINLINREKISWRWGHIIQWSGIRGALAMALLLSLPEWLPNRDLLTFIGLTIVLSSLLINANTIKWVIDKLKIQAFSMADSFEKHECKVVIDQNILLKLDSYKANKFINKATYEKLYKFYKQDENKESNLIEKLIKAKQENDKGNDLDLILKNHFLGIERQIFQKLYVRGEINEKLLHILLNNVDEQIENLESTKKVTVAPFFTICSNNKLLNRFRDIGLINCFLEKRAEQEQTLRYEMYRARVIANNRVITIIKKLKTNRQFDKLIEMDTYLSRYEQWREKAEEKAKEIEAQSPDIAARTELHIMNKLCLQKEEIEVKKLLQAQILSPKVAGTLLADIQERKTKNQSLIVTTN